MEKFEKLLKLYDFKIRYNKNKKSVIGNSYIKSYNNKYINICMREDYLFIVNTNFKSGYYDEKHLYDNIFLNHEHLNIRQSRSFENRAFTINFHTLVFEELKLYLSLVFGKELRTKKLKRINEYI